MRYWHCKCGKLEAWGSDAPASCLSCPHCGTNAYGENPTEHDWMTETLTTVFHGEVKSKTGRYCVNCRKHEQRKVNEKLMIGAEANIERLRELIEGSTSTLGKVTLRESSFSQKVEEGRFFGRHESYEVGDLEVWLSSGAKVTAKEAVISWEGK